MDLDKGIVIIPEYGFCNRLRVIVSYLSLARKKKKKLYVVWDKNKKNCPGHFCDYFEDIPGVIFITQSDITKNTKIRYKGCMPLRNSRKAYDAIKLKPYMLNILQEKHDIIGRDYIAVHVRRTDILRYAKENNKYIETDEEFVKYIKSFANKNNIYVATDNQDTYDKFKNKFPDRIKLPFHDIVEKSYRHTSLRDSIIDIYMCVFAKYFKGTGVSSFSMTIKELRKLYVHPSVYKENNKTK